MFEGCENFKWSARSCTNRTDHFTYERLHRRV